MAKVVRGEKTMKAFPGLVACTLLATAAFGQENPADRELIDKAAANRPTAQAAPAATPRDSGDLGTAEVKARAEVALADARLELVLARKAMRADRFEEAARRALRAQTA